MSLPLPQKRKLVPNWRSIQDTIANGELSSPHTTTRLITKFSIDEYRDRWKESKTISHCGEYLSAATSNCISIDSDVVDAAEFILKIDDILATAPLKILAASIIQDLDKNHTEITPVVMTAIPTTEDYRKDIEKRISVLRKQLALNYNDAIKHIELSQTFLLKGDWIKSVRHAKIASHLAPENRYITRCAVRCFTHVHEYDMAHYALTHNGFLEKDPWLISSDITVDLLRGKSPRNYKRALALKDNKNYSPLSLTEMLMALATLEKYRGGNIKQIKRLTKQAMEAPIDNSLAQAKWLASKIVGLHIDAKDRDVKFNYEIATFDAFRSQNFESSFKNAFLWFQDSSFSRRATLTASSMAINYVNKLNEGIAILELGLIANPNSPELLNNLAYNLILSDEIETGSQKLNIALKHKNSNPETNIFLTATEGLLLFRKNHVQEGKNKYLEAIKAAKKDDNTKYLVNPALINLTREEALAGIITKEVAYKKLDSIKTDDIEILFDINRAKQSLMNKK